LVGVFQAGGDFGRMPLQQPVTEPRQRFGARFVATGMFVQPVDKYLGILHGTQHRLEIVHGGQAFRGDAFEEGLQGLHHVTELFEGDARAVDRPDCSGVHGPLKFEGMSEGIMDRGEDCRAMAGAVSGIGALVNKLAAKALEHFLQPIDADFAEASSGALKRTFFTLAEFFAERSCFRELAPAFAEQEELHLGIPQGIEGIQMPF